MPSLLEAICSCLKPLSNSLSLFLTKNNKTKKNHLSTELSSENSLSINSKVKQAKFMMKIVVVHGGAASAKSEILEAKMSDLRRAAKAGYQHLISCGGTTSNKSGQTEVAVSAIQKSIEVMENSPYFNAGFGSSLTSEGKVENDAILVEGTSLQFGAVCSVTRIRNPIALARTILEKSEHCLFSSEGAHRFAQEHEFELIDNNVLINQFAKDRLVEFRTFSNAIRCDHDETQQKSDKETKDHDTVGAVVLNFDVTAAGTSTGGITGKQPGRVGDTPIIGSGAYADNKLGCVSTTGHGEAIMKVCLARDVLTRYENHLRMDHPEPMQRAVDDALENMRDRVQGYGGVIAVGISGHIGVGFTTRHMPWAYIVDKEVKDDYFAMLARDRSEPASPIEIHYGYERGEHSIAHE